MLQAVCPARDREGGAAQVHGQAGAGLRAGPGDQHLPELPGDQEEVRLAGGAEGQVGTLELAGRNTVEVHQLGAGGAKTRVQEQQERLLGTLE